MAAGELGFRRNAVEVFVARVFVVFILVATNVVVTRKLSTSARGVYALAVALPVMLQMVAGLGINQANIYYVSRAARVRDVVVNSFYLCFAIGAVLLLIAGGFHVLLPHTAPLGIGVGYFFLLLALMPLSFMDLFFTGVVQGLEKFRLFNTRRVWVAGINFFAVVVGVVILGRGLTGAIAALAVTIIATAVMFFIVVVRFDGFGLRPDLPLAGKMTRYGGKSYLASLASYLSFRLDVYLLIPLLTHVIGLDLARKQVAYYAVAVSMVEILWYIPDSIGVVLFPRLSATTSEREVHEFTARVCRLTLLITVVSAAGIALIGRPLIVLLFHRRYLASAAPMWLLLPGAVSMAAYKILWRNFSGRNRQQVTVIASALALALNVGINLVLIPRFKASGASIASSFSYTFGTVILLVVFVRQSGIGYRDTLIVQRADLREEWARIRRRLVRGGGGET
jgi:O-antigen/teichoic acid export membrane protein